MTLSSAGTEPAAKYWLLKAEPDSRIIKGKDVKFSVDDFEAVKTSPWEGVRNYEARNIMQEMKVGDKALFYHSNCKNPGVAAFAEVSKEAYPDYTAWDESHPYFDPKTKQDTPKWFMVDLTFKSRAKHLVPLSLFKSFLALSSPPPELEYIGKEGLTALKAMPLVTRGRLSVQRVDAKAYETVQLLAENGGWDDMNLKAKPGTKKKQVDPPTDNAETTPKAKTRTKANPAKASAASKRKAKDEDEEVVEPSTSEFDEPDSASDFGGGVGEEDDSTYGSSRKRRKVTTQASAKTRSSSRRKRVLKV